MALRLLERGDLDAIIAMGGGAGTSIGSAAMWALPLGISQSDGLDARQQRRARLRRRQRHRDGVPAIVDISGLNRISRGVFTRAAAAVCGMVEAVVPESDDAPTIAASMFGNTTKCVEAARAIIERAGFEVLVFHAVRHICRSSTDGDESESLTLGPQS